MKIISILKNLVVAKQFLLVLFLIGFINTAKADYTVIAGSTIDASTITSQSGVLIINGTLTVSANTNLSSFTSVIINGPNGKINWTNNSDLIFSATVSFDNNNTDVNGGLQSTGDNGSQRLYIGTTIIAVSSDNSSNAAFSFAQFNAAGGLPKFNLTSVTSPYCYTPTFNATLTPIDNVVAFDCVWSIDNANLSPTAKQTNFTTAQTAVITPANVVNQQTYNISCTIFRAGDGDPITTRIVQVVVNPIPAAPTSLSTSNNNICVGSNTNIKAITTTDFIQWYTVITNGTVIGSSASNANFSVSPSVTTNYYAESKNNSTGCTSSTRGGPLLIIVDQASVGGSISGNANVCSGSNNSNLLLTSYTGNVTRWESSLNNFSNASTGITNTNNLLTATNLLNTTYYRAVIKNGTCSSVNSSVAVLTVSSPGTWLGVNANWNSTLNWCNGTLPTALTDVSIGIGLTNYPVITTTAAVKNLTISTGGTALITITGALSIAGTISSTNGIIANTGTIELNGSAAQTISGNNFAFNTIGNLLVNNSLNGATSSSPSVAISAAGGMLKIANSLSFGGRNNMFLNTNDTVTLLSTTAVTARVADITNNDVNTGNTITGKFVVERYVPAKRAWRLLTAPVTAASLVKISDSWQEGARVTNPSAAITASTNPNPGYGTHVTYGSLTTNGYDQGINSNSNIRYLTSTGWNGVPTATNSGSSLNSGYITDQQGLFLFVRGDRSTQLSLGTNTPLTTTTLRIKGAINTGSVVINLGAKFVYGNSNFRVIGNPFPSAINFNKIIQNTGNPTGANAFANAFYIWDPYIGSNAVGGWVAMSYNSISGKYNRTVMPGGFISSIDITGDIQSGSAIMIDYNGAATTIQIKESNKATGSNISQFRPAADGTLRQLRISLLEKYPSGKYQVNDGVLTSFDKTYSNAVDEMDMKKLPNFTENLSIYKEDKTVAIERRLPITGLDTILFSTTHLRQKKYALEFAPDGLITPDGTAAFLEDAFLKTATPIHIKDTSRYQFNVTADTASSNSNRFRLVFKPSLQYVFAEGKALNEDALITWELHGELNINHYAIEKSADGNIFTTTGIILNKENSIKPVTYSFTDTKPAAGNYYYRIKGISNDSIITYSKIMLVKIVNNMPGMYIFPNPVSNNVICLQINAMKEGAYYVKLYNNAGSLLYSSIMQGSGRYFSKLIEPKKLMSNGCYYLVVISPEGKVIKMKCTVIKN